MISLATILEQAAPASDPRVSRVLDYAEFYGMASGLQYWRLRKPLGKYHTGQLVTLAELHRLLFP